MSAGIRRAVSTIKSIMVLCVVASCTDVDLPSSNLNIPSGGATGTPVGILSSISVSLSTSTVKVGQTTKATASGMDQFGRPFATGVVTWSTTPEGLATVTDDGTVTAIADGVVTVLATKAPIPPGSASLVISR